MKLSLLEPQMRKNLINLAETYASAKNYRLATVSRKAHGNHHFFDQLKAEDEKGERTDAKSSFTTRIYDRLVTWFILNWPDYIEFPTLLLHEVIDELDSDLKSRGESLGKENVLLGDTVQTLSRLRKIHGQRNMRGMLSPKSPRVGRKTPRSSS